MEITLVVSIMILAISALLQMWAAGISFSLIQDLEDRGNWFLIALGFTFMALRRIASLSEIYMTSFSELPNVYVEIIALVTSAFFVMGLRQVKPYVKKLQGKLLDTSISNERANRENEELKRFNSFLARNIHVPCRQAEADIQFFSKNTITRLNDEEKKHLNSLTQQFGKMKDLGDKLLLHARAQNGSFARESINFSDLIREVEVDLRKKDRNVEVMIDDGIFVNSEPHVLKESMDVLLDSITKSPSTGQVYKIDISRNSVGNGSCNLIFNCEGFRMNQFEKLNLYSPFSGLRTYRDLEGHGLNMSVVSSIVHSLHGRIWAEKKESGGTLIYLSL